MGTIIIIVIILAVLLAVAGSALRVVQQFEKGIIFRLGRIQASVREPGLTVIVPVIDRMQKVNMQIVTMGIPGQDGITRDNVTVRVDAVVYFRVIDPVKAIVNVQNYMFAVSQVAQTSLRSVIGRSDLDELLSERDRINAQLREIIDEPTEAPWGIRIERVEIKDVALPESMKRSMSRQAEAERDRRGRIISADGEFQASKRLAAAAEVMARDPASLQLRLLQTVVEVAAERNSTLVMPLPVEMLRFFEKAAGMATGAAEGGESGRSQAARERAAPDPGDLEDALANTPEPPAPPAIEQAGDRTPVPGLEEQDPGDATPGEPAPAKGEGTPARRRTRPGGSG